MAMLTPAPIGRDDEFRALREALDAALVRHGGLVLIGGEAGIGKTTLAEAICAEARGRGALVLIGRCYDLAETPPYGPWSEALASAPRVTDLPPPDLTEGSSSGQATLFAVVRDYVAALADRQPLIILLDDLHWADPASLDLLRTLARGLGDLPLLLLATYRADELTRRHALYQLLPILVREARATRLDLSPLDTPELRTLVRARYALGGDDEDRLVAHLAAHAEGNPFYADELLRSLESDRIVLRANDAWSLGDLAAVRVPPLLRQVIDARVDRLGEDARSLLAVAAVIGQSVPLDLWMRVADTDEETLLSVADAAAEARVLAIAEDGERARFAHALIREALYEGVPPLRRRSRHRRVGEALAAWPTTDPDAVAYHFRQAGDERAYAWLVRAGERAQRAYAWITAAQRYEAALALLGATADTAAERGWLMFHIGRLRRYVDPHGSIAYMDEAEQLAAIAADRALAACVLLERGLFRCFVGEIRRGIAEMEAGSIAYDALSRDEQARIWALRTDNRRANEDDGRGTLAMWLAIAGHYAEARTLGERADSSVDGAIGLARALAGQGEPDAAAKVFERARTTYGTIGHNSLVAGSAIGQLELVALPYQADRPEERRRLEAVAVQARALAGGVVITSVQQFQQLDRALVLEMDGHWTEASAIFDIFRAASGNTRWAAFASLFARLAHRQGNVERAAALIREWLPGGHATDPGDGVFINTVGLQRVAAALAIDAGDLPLAQAWLAAHDRWLEWNDSVLGRAEGELLWAVYDRAAGDLAAAHEHAERALAHASAPRQPLALLAAHRTLGELATLTGRHTDAQAHLDQSLALAEVCAAPYERALTILALAELRAALGARDGANAALADARTILTNLDARPALARAEALAARLADAPPARTAEDNIFGLTARELEVLRLAAQGLTDPQVAERLYISRNTVNAHLRGVYGKLGVNTRTAAARLAAEHGLI